MKAFGLGKLFGFVIILGTLAAGGWWWMQGGQAVQYQTVPLARGEIDATINATGTCNAVVTVQVGSQVSGNIKALYADFNTKVKKDQLVALIEPEIFQAKVDQARAKVDSDNSAVVNAQAGVQKVEADVASAKANLANMQANQVRAKVMMDDAKSKLDHDNDLFKRGIVSGEERDTAQATHDSAVASLKAADAQTEAAQHAIKAAEAQREVAQTQLTAAQAQLRQSKAALVQAEIDLKHTEIKAPVDGTVVARRMDVGQTVAASFQAPTIFEIAQDLTKMQIDTNVDEADIGQVRVGQTATFTVDAYPGEMFSGKITQIRQAPNIVQNVVTYDVVVEVPNNDLKLFPGMTANVQILTDRRENVLMLPNAALRVRLGEGGKPTGAGPSGMRGKSGPGGQGGAGAAGGAKGPGMRGGAAGARGGAPGMGKGGPGGGARGAGNGNKGRAPVTTVWVLGPGDKPHPVTVTLGISDGNFSAVESGDLRDGDPVIVGVVMPKGTAASGPFGGGGIGGPAGGGGMRRGMGF